jgi:hypothetical protein
MTAYYWDGGSAVAREIENASTSGALLNVPNAEQWYPGTLVTVLLQRAPEHPETPAAMDSISVRCKVVRMGVDGLGVVFLLDNREERKAVERLLRRSLADAGKDGIALPAEGTRGQALVEFALMVPFLFLLILVMVNFGSFIYGWITVANAARSGAQYAVLGGASVGMPSTPGNSLVQALVTSDTASLPAGTSVCINTNATASAVAGTCSFTIASIPADPEAPTYTVLAMDVYYPYSSLFPHFKFPALGITDLPGMPGHIQRRVMMRILN